MNTVVYSSKSRSDIEACARLILAGGLVAFPTETVYGLGANGMSETAVQKIFVAKGRPQDNPLIMHVDGAHYMKKLYRAVPSVALKLAERFWPGPLTLIFDKSELVPAAVSASLATVGLRMPDNSAAIDLIRACGVPIAAPSANTSGSPSPTSCSHVLNDLNGRIDAVLDGGVCRCGVESTVLSLVAEPTVLRPGTVTAEQLSEVIGEPVRLAPALMRELAKDETAQSPGMKHLHYHPRARVFAVLGSEDDMVRKTIDKYDKEPHTGIILCSRELSHRYGERRKIVLGQRSNPDTFCHSLFGALRQCDEMNMSFVLCESLDTEGSGLAYMNRLLRAAGFNTI